MYIYTRIVFHMSSVQTKSFHWKSIEGRLRKMISSTEFQWEKHFHLFNAHIYYLFSN